VRQGALSDNGEAVGLLHAMTELHTLFAISSLALFAEI
jgi:hypothetical protein